MGQRFPCVAAPSPVVSHLGRALHGLEVFFEHRARAPRAGGRQMDQLESMRLFVRVVEAGGFSTVARALRITQPTVSKAIAALESRLGAQLLRRTSRNLSLTEAGREYYQSAMRLLGELDAVESRVARGNASPSGLLRVTLPAGVARLHLVPLLPAFLSRFPDVDLDIDVSD